MAKQEKAKDKTKRPVGRPSTYDPAYCERVIELGAEGKSPEAIAATLGVLRQTMLAWAEVHPEFFTALEQAKELELLWWEEAGQKALYADKFQNAVWSKSMQARFRHKYTEQQVTTLQGPNGGPINTKTEVVITIINPSTDRIV